MWKNPRHYLWFIHLITTIIFLHLGALARRETLLQMQVNKKWWTEGKKKRRTLQNYICGSDLLPADDMTARMVKSAVHINHGRWEDVLGYGNEHDVAEYMSPFRVHFLFSGIEREQKTDILSGFCSFVCSFFPSSHFCPSLIFKLSSVLHLFTAVSRKKLLLLLPRSSSMLWLACTSEIHIISEVSRS